MPERFKVTKADEANADMASKDEESAMGHLLEENKGKNLKKKKIQSPTVFSVEKMQELILVRISHYFDKNKWISALVFDKVISLINLFIIQIMLYL